MRSSNSGFQFAIDLQAGPGAEPPRQADTADPEPHHRGQTTRITYIENRLRGCGDITHQQSRPSLLSLRRPTTAPAIVVAVSPPSAQCRYPSSRGLAAAPRTGRSSCTRHGRYRECIARRRPVLRPGLLRGGRESHRRRACRRRGEAGMSCGRGGSLRGRLEQEREERWL